MSSSMLERQPFACEAVNDEHELLQDNVADEAYLLLGYATDQAKIRRLLALQKTLEELGIQPFTEESVEDYKRSREVPPNRFAAAMVNFASAVGLISAVVCLPVLVISAVTFNASLSFYLSIAILVGGGFLIASAALGDRFVVERAWVTYDLAHYIEQVPEFALQTAVDIKKRHPEVKFHICSLEENRTVLDPFLVMRVPDGSWYRDYYLEVWNEPKFSGKREA